MAMSLVSRLTYTLIESIFRVNVILISIRFVIIVIIRLVQDHERSTPC